MVLYFSVFFVSAVGAWLMMKNGSRLGVNDSPNHRSSHNKIIPKGGGFGILFSLIISCLLLSVYKGFWIPALVISLISFWGGDKHRFSPMLRLLFQFTCSIVFLLSLVGYKHYSVLDLLMIIPFSVFIVGTSNLYNFMDGIDGIAGITAMVGFALLAVYADLIDASAIYKSICMVMVFSSLGFLCFNFPKAKVFLGDIGSILIGFVFACMVILFSNNLCDFLVMTGFLAPFYFDELFTMSIRMRNGESLLKPHRKHLYQLLANEFGISHWKISLAYGVAQLLIGLSAIALKPMGAPVLMLVYLTYCLIFVFISLYVRDKVLAG